MCYKKGGPLAVTDANLVLGRLLPHYFPKIFGPQENEPLDKDSVIKAFKKITNEVSSVMFCFRFRLAVSVISAILKQMCSMEKVLFEITKSFKLQTLNMESAPFLYISMFLFQVNCNLVFKYFQTIRKWMRASIFSNPSWNSCLKHHISEAIISQYGLYYIIYFHR